jgi:hypothetical protein
MNAVSDCRENDRPAVSTHLATAYVPLGVDMSGLDQGYRVKLASALLPPSV